MPHLSIYGLRMQASLTEALRALKARMEAFLASRVLTRDDDWADSIRRAVSMQAAADDVVRAVVQQARQNGATWQVDTLHALEDDGNLDRPEALREMLRRYLPLMHENVPVHDWK